MFALDHELIIGNKLFPAVKNVELESSNETMSDLLKIDLAYYKKLDPSSIRPGTPVRFSAGYSQYGIAQEFEGLVNDVSPTQPYSVKCYDYFDSLNGEKISRTFTNTEAGSIIQMLLADNSYIDTSEIQMGSYIKYRPYQQKTKLFVIQDLAQLSGYVAFMRGNKLIFDKPDRLAPEKIPVYTYGNNLISDTISFSDKGEYSKIVIVSRFTDGTGKVLRAEKGDGARVKKIVLHDISQGELYDRLDTLFKQYCKGGYAGEITSFGFPQTTHSQQIQFFDKRYPDKNGQYLVTKNIMTYSDQGYRRKLSVVKHEV
ncbi:MAG: hypothetical protein JXK07_09960 [Spirochaetes bacterium]|nr:hypothetical protein [Spirochaetota bacterium]MBN2771278.1 hypothetical protein [Spirochaetota bacterium]